MTFCMMVYGTFSSWFEPLDQEIFYFQLRGKLFVLAPKLGEAIEHIYGYYIRHFDKFTHKECKEIQVTVCFRPPQLNTDLIPLILLGVLKYNPSTKC